MKKEIETYKNMYKELVKYMVENITSKDESAVREWLDADLYDIFEELAYHE